MKLKLLTLLIVASIAFLVIAQMVPGNNFDLEHPETTTGPPSGPALAALISATIVAGLAVRVAWKK